MSNREIIATECMIKGIMEEVYTFQEWKKRGYQVQKGQKACLQTKVWKPVESKNKQTGEKEKKMILVTGSFFSRSQVKPLEAK